MASNKAIRPIGLQSPPKKIKRKHLETAKCQKKKTTEKSEKTYRCYDKAELVQAAKQVRELNMTIYKASKLSKVPYNTLKKFLQDNEDLDHPDIPKMGRPFALPVEIEKRIYDYIIDMQELGFGLTVMQIRKLSFDLAQSINREHFLNPETKTASKWWWAKFKERYGLCLRVPENLSAYRASMANPVIIKDYFTKLDALLTKLKIKDCPSKIWNVDETGLAYVVRPNKVVCKIGKKYVYKRTYGERAQTQTLVGCACADGTFIPPFIIFKGLRWIDSLKDGCLPNAKTNISQKGWITTELFIDWFKFFISSIPERPIVLLMDSHSSHIGPEILNLAKQNKIYLMTFPAHTSHLLQPLDVGVYRSLKIKWSNELNSYMIKHPNDKPNRYNFYEIFNPAFLASFSPMNIINSFRKAGACPLKYDAVSADALAPSRLTDRPVNTTNNEPNKTVDELLQTPSAPKKINGAGTRKKKDSSAKCLTPVEETTVGLSAQTSGILDRPIAGTSGLNVKSKNSKDDNDWVCGVCTKKYSNDEKKKTGASWVQCSFCYIPYHEKCQQSPADKEIFMCDKCGEASDSEI